MHRQLITHLLDAENDLLFVLLRHFKADDTPIAHIESDSHSSYSARRAQRKAGGGHKTRRGGGARVGS